MSNTSQLSINIDAMSNQPENAASELDNERKHQSTINSDRLMSIYHAIKELNVGLESENDVQKFNETFDSLMEAISGIEQDENAKGNIAVKTLIALCNKSKEAIQAGLQQRKALRGVVGELQDADDGKQDHEASNLCTNCGLLQGPFPEQESASLNKNNPSCELDHELNSPAGQTTGRNWKTLKVGQGSRELHQVNEAQVWGAPTDDTVSGHPEPFSNDTFFPIQKELNLPLESPLDHRSQSVSTPIHTHREASEIFFRSEVETPSLSPKAYTLPQQLHPVATALFSGILRTIVWIILTALLWFAAMQTWISCLRERTIWLEANNWTKMYVFEVLHFEPTWLLVPGSNPNLSWGVHDTWALLSVARGYMTTLFRSSFFHAYN